MNRFKGFVCLILIIEVVLVLLCNGIYIHQSQSDKGRLYRVETARVAREIEEQNLTVEQVEAMDLSAYETLVKVTVFRPEEICNNDYAAFDAFVEKVSALAEKLNVKVVMTSSIPVEEASEIVKKYL